MSDRPVTQINESPWWGRTQGGNKVRIDWCRPDPPDGKALLWRWYGYVQQADGKWESMTWGDNGKNGFFKSEAIVGPSEEPIALPPWPDWAPKRAKCMAFCGFTWKFFDAAAEWDGFGWAPRGALLASIYDWRDRGWPEPPNDRSKAIVMAPEGWGK